MKHIDEAALFHQPKSAWCALLNQNTLQLTLRCKANNLKEVILVSFPRYGASKIQYPERIMQPILRDKEFDYYQITLCDIPVKRFAYYFKLQAMASPQENSTVYSYTEIGLSELATLQANGTIWNYAFQFPYFNAIDIHEVPEWAKGAVVYEIFPDRFGRSYSSAELEQTLPLWGSKPTGKIRIGGNLQGIIEKLPYLQELGINLLYMTPIFQAHSNHKYDTIDYKQIDPDFGSNEDFRQLVAQCHSLGIRVILDAVFNHCGPGFEPFIDVQKNGENSRYKDWFHILRYPVASADQLWASLETKASEQREALKQKNTNSLAALTCNEEVEVWAMGIDADGWTTLPYETFAFTPMMPKLNTENPKLREYLLDVAEYWVREYDIDGWRLDVANEVDHHFWREFRQRVRAVKNDALIVGEIFHDSRPWLQGDQFDCVMNYPFQNISFDFFLNQSITSQQARGLFNKLLLRYSPQVNQVQWNMLDSHDTARLFHRCYGDVAMVKLLLGMMLSYVGVPVIYYGTELGLDGAGDPDCRRCMPWQRNQWNFDILQHVQTLIALRKSHSVLRYGSLRWLELEHRDILAFERFHPEDDDSQDRAKESCLFLFNRGEQSIVLPASYHGQTNLLTGSSIQTIFAPYSMLVIESF